MSKRLITLIVLGGVLVLAVAAYIVVPLIPRKAPPMREDPRVAVDQVDVETVQKIVLRSAERTLTLEKKDGAWTVNGRTPTDLNTTKIEDIAYSFASLWAERLVEENPASLADYGLDKPAQIATAYLADGSSRTYLLGARTTTGNMYYLMPENTPKVYAVWMNHGANFSATLDDLRNTTMPTVDTENIQYLKLARKGGQTIEMYLAKQEDTPSPYVFGSWYMIKPYTQPRGIDSEKLQEILQSLYFTETKSFVEENARDLARYGLEPPQGEIVLKDATNTFHILVGKNLDEYTTYFRYSGSRNVYTIDSSRLGILESKAFSLTDKFVFITNIDGVDQIVVSRGTETHTIDIKREGKDENGNWTSVFTIDGKVVADEPFRKFYQKVIGVSVDAEAEKTVTTKPVATFTFRLAADEALRRGKLTVVVEFLDYNRDFYLVRRDGVAEFVTAKNRDVEEVFTELPALLQ